MPTLNDATVTSLIESAFRHLQRGEIEQARQSFERAASLRPNEPDLELAVGNCLAMLGRRAEAERVYRQLVERQPQHALALFNLGNVVNEQGRHEEASVLYSRVTRLTPQFAEAHNNLGAVLHRLARLEEAESALRECLRLKPGFLPAYASLVVVLNDLRRPHEAEALCRESLARDPNQQIAHSLLGKALALQDRWHDAVASHQKAVTLNPGSAEAHGYLGDALARTGRHDEALAEFDRAIALDPATPYPHFAKAIALFALGRIFEGAAEFRHREARKLIETQHPGIAFSDALPADLAGRRVLLFGEQGIGDELFFLRYAAAVKSRGALVDVRANPKIAGILRRCGAIDEVTTPADPPPHPPADTVVLVGDLPLAMGPSSPTFPPPLALNPRSQSVESAVQRLSELGPPPYVGLTWRAGTDAQAQRGHIWLLSKEMPLEPLGAAVRGIAATLVSLQRNPGAGETEALGRFAGRPVHDLSAFNENLEDMLALLSVIDDYIGVSSTNMHLRASVGRTAHVLVPWPAEWRWMATGDESPWFPGFRTYRQRSDGGWVEALQQLKRDLQVHACQP